MVDRTEVAQRGAGRAEGAGEGDVEDAIPFLVGHLDDGRLPAESGVVDEHVDTSELIGGAGDEGVDLFGGRHVAHDRRDLLFGELGRELLR